MSRCAIIGGGISGLAAGYYLQKHIDNISIDLFEAQPRPGGVIQTEIHQDCILEGGPDSFLTQKKAAIDLCRDLGLENQLVGSNDSIRKTFVYNGEKLIPLPEGFVLMVPTRILPFITTDLISWPGKFAAITDFFSFPEETDVSVADFVGKRFGKEILDQVAEPLLAGVYGASIERLSTKSALPQLWELQKKGSLLRSLFRKIPAQNESLFTTLQNGMSTLAQSLQQNSPRTHWKFGTTVMEIDKKQGRWIVEGEEYEALLIASSSIPLIKTVQGERIRQELNTIRRNSAIVILLCFEKTRREGFGWLVPAKERRSILACTYVSNKFANRSPADRFLVRVFIGGEQAAQWIEKNDDEILSEVERELNRIANISEEPIFHRIFRWKNAMPEYHVGHERRIELLAQLCREEGNLYLTGNLFSGVGMPDCIRHAKATAADIALQFSGPLR